MFKNILPNLVRDVNGGWEIQDVLHFWDFMLERK